MLEDNFPTSCKSCDHVSRDVVFVLQICFDSCDNTDDDDDDGDDNDA
jgi:pyruvate formate-lyase activating enzyme-like uncharacterized protein